MRISLSACLLVAVVTALASRVGAQTEGEKTAPASGDLQLMGIVVDHMGAGIGEAEVRIDLPTSKADDPPLVHSVSNSGGKIEVSLKRPAADRLRVRVSKTGFREYVGELDISDPDEPPFIDVTLQGAARVEGVVKGPDDKPLAGIDVLYQGGGKRFAARTGGDGRFALDSVYYGKGTVTAKGGNYAVQSIPVAVDDDVLKLDMSLQFERPVELTIVSNTREPAAEVTVEVICEPEAIQLAAVSDQQGKAVLHGVPPDCEGLSLRLNGERFLVMRTYDEHVRLPDLEEGSRTSTQPASVRARLTLTLAGTVRGRVTDKKTGEAVVGVRVTAGREPRYDMPVDWTNAEGAYELTGVRPGIVTLTFRDDAYATAFASVELDTGKTSTLDAALDPGVSLGGIVVDDEGKPLDQVRVAADDWRDYHTVGLRAVTGADGRFLFEHVPPGQIGLHVVRPGYGDPLEVTLSAGKTDHSVVLQGDRLPTESAPEIEEKPRLSIGRPVPDLAMTATDGTKLRISELRGKYVLLDCWASWCGPCMAEMPNVKAVHNAMKDRPDFVMIGISLDTDEAAFKKAIAAKGVSWPQVFGPKSGASEAFEELDGVGIPYTCLIGPDGKLLAQHFRGPGMIDLVKSKCEKTK